MASKNLCQLCHVALYSLEHMVRFINKVEWSRVKENKVEWNSVNESIAIIKEVKEFEFLLLDEIMCRKRES